MKLPDGMQAAVFTDPSNLFYLTGYSNSDAAVVIIRDKTYYVTDKRCLSEAGRVMKGFETVDSDGESYVSKAVSLLSAKEAETVGVEKDTILYRNYLLFAEKFKKIADVSPYIKSLRAVKSFAEVEKIKAAQRITDEVFVGVPGAIKEDMTERELACAIDCELVKRGACPAFDTIAAFGENTALPHAHPGNRRLKYGDPVTVDFGAKLNGYCSDMTRSFVFGKANEEYEKAYNAVLGAKNEAESRISAGMSGKECDNAARQFLARRGLDKYFTHSLGHSLGIDIHEAPNLSPRSDETIPEGAVTSVEPGVYIDGKFGIRIEDIVLFKKTGVENLTNSDEHLIII